MNGERYKDVLTTHVVPLLKQRRNRNLLFQQDGAPAHFSLIVRDVLNKELSGRWIGCGGCVPWPPRSPDLSVNDFWLWGDIRTDSIHRRVLVLFLNWESVWKICYKASLLKPLRKRTTHSSNAATCALQLKVGILSSCYKFLLCMKYIYIYIYIWNITIIHNVCSCLWCYLISLKIGGINMNTLYNLYFSPALPMF